MSTRYIKKDNKVIVGLAKNASQSIKQLAIDNHWEIHEEKDYLKFQTFVDVNNKNMKIYFPLRNIMERARSEFLQSIDDRFTLQSSYIYFEQWLNEQVQENSFYPQYNYFENWAMKFFIEKVFNNSEWLGCDFYFFDLNKFDESFLTNIGFDNVYVPYKNTFTERISKRLGDVLITNSEFKFKYCSKDFIRNVNTVQNPFIELIKKSKHWLDLDG